MKFDIQQVIDYVRTELAVLDEHDGTYECGMISAFKTVIATMEHWQQLASLDEIQLKLKELDTICNSRTKTRDM